MKRSVGLIVPAFVLAVPVKASAQNIHGKSVEVIHFLIKREFVGRAHLTLQEFEKGRVVEIQSPAQKHRLILQVETALITGLGNLDVTAMRYQNLPLSWQKGGAYRD